MYMIVQGSVYRIPHGDKIIGKFRELVHTDTVLKSEVNQACRQIAEHLALAKDVPGGREFMC